jgi:predicted Zn-dependent protease
MSMHRSRFPSRLPRAARTRLGAFLVLMALGLGGCEQVPITGRSKMTLIKHDDLVRVGTIVFDQRKLQLGVSHDRELNDRLQRVGRRLADVAFWDVPDADWEFLVFNQPYEVSAESAPGGKIGVTAGMFKIMKTDGQLAWIVAHEISHLAARHADERISQAMIAQGTSLVAAAGVLATGGAGVVAQNGLQAYELSAALMRLSFDRKQELEADYMGLIYMARAGFDPEEGLRSFENLTEATQDMPRPAAMLSTHPEFPERAIQLIDKMPLASAEYRSAQSGRRNPPPAK